MDDSSQASPREALPAIGAIVPKRHARRAVTRSLIRRQIYAAADRRRAELAPGLWIVRQQAAFDRALFRSAASAALRSAARQELDGLFGAALSFPTQSSS